ncbi:hypothetical protein E0F91_12255 [Flavobacterium sandaracinum]|uniref:DUF421 domain-containing protein n=1 Tax=Flavobacterium sandaracinum TaxID=2541733 RepID=A0A4R5CQI2_9FLAO|nr:hypothetical protein E0F91_12255 [Flavobacterium sandaracinum]
MNEYLAIILRSSAVYFFMVVSLQLLGKKELSQLNTADVLLILLISRCNGRKRYQFMARISNDFGPFYY